eukprot:CAMPEP_0117673866 /NCGR_PEP_ID=MMETSP0804-20121206/14716_1 /TAXON_ID=1074897 /ORGANISM="Tetraselmis astigmatica, Strain CCMP880" /LENGTH=451 /DNA_ID=CAMNT_0005482663 /DNA_START=234 /DNA_END=1585 /DNA_ORIENTATION=+
MAEAPSVSPEQEGAETEAPSSGAAGTQPQAPPAAAGLPAGEEIGADVDHMPNLDSGSTDEEGQDCGASPVAAEPRHALLEKDTDGTLKVYLPQWFAVGWGGAKAVAAELAKERNLLIDKYGLPVDFLLKVAGLLVLRRVDLGSYRLLEAAAVVLPLPCRRVPCWGPAKSAAALARSILPAVLTTRGVAVADKLLECVMPRFRRKRSASCAALDSLQDAPLEPYLMRAAIVALLHSEEMEKLKQLLAIQGVSLPQDRFHTTNAELCRFAAAHGLTEGKKRKAVVHGAKMIAQMLRWREGYDFMDEAEMTQWCSYVRFSGSDDKGRPILVVLLGKAMCTLTKADRGEFVRAIMSNVEHVVTHTLSDMEGEPEHLTVVLDACGCRAWQVPGTSRVFRQVTRMLTRFYPARLARLYVVDLPLLPRCWFEVMASFLHPTTKQKLVFCSSDDPDLPV